MDPQAIELSEKLNNQYVADNWRYKGVVVDVNTLDFSNLQFETGNELINTELDVIINTSCEHMNMDWFDSVSDNTLIVMQTNNSKHFEGHINTCGDIEEMKIKYPMHTMYREANFSFFVFLTRIFEIKHTGYSKLYHELF